ncbi:MAG TPA: glycosyltransferase family 4 protein, partial [Dehalococcoidia bacterium]|nr:glycosyltransferase family 4 protein [Dehalococcoidia bacterium]
MPFYQAASDQRINNQATHREGCAQLREAGSQSRPHSQEIDRDKPGDSVTGSLLVLCNEFPDQDDTQPSCIFIKEQVAALAHFWERIHVLVPYPAGLEWKRHVRYRSYDMTDNVSVSFVRYHNPLFPFCWYHWKHAWLTHEIHTIGSWLQRSRIEPRLIHAHFTWPSGVAASILAQRRSIPFVITEHSHNMEPLLTMPHGVFLHAWSEADALVRVSNAQANEWERACGREILRIPNGFDAALMRPGDRKNARRQLGLPQERRLILNVAVLREYKGHRYLLEAMALLADRCTDVDCVIVGSGHLLNSLRQQVSNLGLEGRVCFAGLEPHKSLPDWFAACDVFCLPSLAESFGIVQLEAMACGRPVVATRNGGSESVVTDSDVGLLCEPADSQGLACTLLKALQTDWKEHRIVAHAQQFTWFSNAQQYMKLFQRILDSS